ncbi:MAG: DUF4870 domain-containing protein [Candidatus Hinthialibacter antarcticus]|nr:DUF4870 domain-containing protein [Candidatus Hinthialibacter antarcticus]
MNQIDKEARTWAMICHLGGFLIFIIPPVGHLIGPLIIWLIKKDEHPFLDDQGKEALNFQISFTIYTFIAAFLCLFVIGALLLPVLFITWVVLMIVAAIKANDGDHYRYPLIIRLI